MRQCQCPNSLLDLEWAGDSRERSRRNLELGSSSRSWSSWFSLIDWCCAACKPQKCEGVFLDVGWLSTAADFKCYFWELPALCPTKFKTELCLRSRVQITFVVTSSFRKLVEVVVQDGVHMQLNATVSWQHDELGHVCAVSNRARTLGCIWIKILIL